MTPTFRAAAPRPTTPWRTNTPLGRLVGIVAILSLLLLLLPTTDAPAQSAIPNDQFVDAEVLATDGTLTATNVDASSELGEPVHAGVGGGASIWYQWAAPQDGFLTVDTFGSDFDTVLAMYTGAAVDTLTEVASNDDAGSLQSELPNVPVVSGTVYSIAVDGFGGASGNVTLTWSFWDGADTTPPTVTISTPLDGATFVQNGVVPADYTCADEVLGSGVATCVGDVPNGEPIATASLGTQSFTVTGTDNAGNVASVTHSYTISGTDVTPPLVTITSPGDGSVYGVGAVVTASYTCTDELFGTGVASCTGDVADGTAIDTSTPGTFSLTVTGTDGAGNTAVRTHTYTVVDSPANDDFVAAEVLAADGTLDAFNIGATKEVGEPDHAGNPGGASIWYQWTSPMDGYLTIETTGSSFDTVMAMYTGSSVDALTEIASNDDASGLQSRLLNVPVTLGSTYHVAVDGYFGLTGSVTLTWLVVEQFDTTPPTATIWDPIDGLTVPQGYEETVFYTCADDIGGSGIASCVGDLPNFDPLPTSVPGTFTFTATATDNAGNVGVTTHTYTILANPPNDDFVDAEPIATDGTLNASNVGATQEPGEPDHAGNVAGTSIWYQWTAPSDGFLTIDTDGSDFDTILGLYSGTSVDALTEIASAFVGSPTKIWYAPVTGGSTYHIAVSGFIFATGNVTMNWSFLDGTDTTPPMVTITTPVDGSVFFEGVSVLADYSCEDEFLGSGVATCVGDVATGTPIDTSTVGSFTFTVTGTDNDGNVAVETTGYTVLALTNDAFADAVMLPATGEVVGSNVGASKELGEPNHAGNPGGASVWFQWTAPADGFLTLETLGSDFDTTLAVYTGASVDALTELGSNDNAGGGLQSVVADILVTAGSTYHIAVDGFDGASGQFDLDWVLFGGPVFNEVSPPADPLWVTDLDHDFWVNTAAPADIDGDGDLDLAVLGYFVEYSVSAEDMLVVFINEGPDANGDWVFTHQNVPLGSLFAGEVDLSWGDFDGDGDPDLAVATAFGTEIYQNDAGTLAAIPTDLPVYFEDSNYTGAYDLRSLTWADFDNDGDLDLFIPSLFNDVTFTFETALMRNDGPDGAGGWIFTDVDAAIDGSVHAQTAWADDDGDGDLDLFVANVDNFLGDGWIRIYRNNAGAFTMEEPIGSVRVEYGLADWADYDQDGDMDILVVGNIQDVDGNFKTVLRIYRNDAGTFVENTIIQTSFFPWLDLHAATWADYDSDGDNDLLITGTFIGPENIEGKSEVYVNEGGTFVPLGRELPAPMGSVGNGGSFTWFDIDGDGDLDYFVAGAYWVPGGNNTVESQMHLYRNHTLGLNAAPAAPTGLSSTVEGDQANLSWNAAVDDSTSSQAVTYDLVVQPAAGGAAAATAETAAAFTGRRLPEPGNISAVTAWQLRGLADGTYTWSVQAVDSAFNGGPVAEGTFTIGDVVDAPPTVSLTNPANGSTVSGTLTITTAASDDIGVASVEVFVDGTSLGFDTGAGVVWNTATVADGSHTISATATDTIGQTATASITVTVANGVDDPPTVAITFPTRGSTVSGVITITTTSSDDFGVVSVQVLVDGVSIGFDTGSGVAWDTTAVGNGPHRIQARATDTAGQTTTRGTRVTVDNTTTDTPPTVAITAPNDGATVSGTITVTTSSSDDVGVTSVEVLVDGVSIGFDTGSGVAWDSSTVGDGMHEISATATDTAGQTATAVATVTVNNGGTGGATVHVGDLDGGTTTIGTRLAVEVAITVHDDTEVPVAGVTVSGTWTTGRRTTPAECVTDAFGACTLTNQRVSSRLAEAIFTVNGLTLADLTYDPVANHDPDGDSDGTTIVIPITGAV